MHSITRLQCPPSEADLHSLAQLLVEAVDSGAAVSFLAGLDVVQATKWWRAQLENAHPKFACLVARDAAGRIIGTAQLLPAWAPNQPHRAEVAKVLVAEHVRGQGIGFKLMECVESHALSVGFALLTLDCKRAGTAERLYKRAGWNCVGIIPDFALDTNGATLHDTVVYYKNLRPTASPPTTPATSPSNTTH